MVNQNCIHINILWQTKLAKRKSSEVQSEYYWALSIHMIFVDFPQGKSKSLVSLTQKVKQILFPTEKL